MPKFHLFNGPDKLASVQALTIYTILIAGIEDRCQILSVVLVFVMSVSLVHKAFIYLSLKLCQEIAGSLQPRSPITAGVRNDPWSIWLFDESIKRWVMKISLPRTEVSYYIITMQDYGSFMDSL